MKYTILARIFVVVLISFLAIFSPATALAYDTTSGSPFLGLGLGYNIYKTADVTALGNPIVYNWGYGDTGQQIAGPLGGAANPSVDFGSRYIPMLYGCGAGELTTFKQKLLKNDTNPANDYQGYILFLNEPDNAGQANCEPQVAVTVLHDFIQWRNTNNLNIDIIFGGVYFGPDMDWYVNGNNGNIWLDDFIDAWHATYGASNNPDIAGVHFHLYSWLDATYFTDHGYTADDLAQHLKQRMIGGYFKNDPLNRVGWNQWLDANPWALGDKQQVWITEFGTATLGADPADVIPRSYVDTALPKVVNYLLSNNRVDRILYYSNSVPRAAYDTQQGNPIGATYANSTLVNKETLAKMSTWTVFQNLCKTEGLCEKRLGEDFKLVFMNNWGTYPNWSAPPQFLFYPKYTLDVLANDGITFSYDAQNVQVVVNPKHGQVMPKYNTSNNTMVFEYVPDHMYKGYDDFTYKVTSSTGEVYMAKASIAVMEFYIDYLTGYYNGGQYNGPVPSYLQGGFLAPGTPEPQKVLAPSPSASRDPAGEGFQSYWKFDETSGTTAYDTSINHLDKIATGAVWQAGRTNNSLYFDGVDDHVSLGNYDLTSNQVTFSAWINTTDVNSCATNECRIISKATGTSSSNHYWMLSEALKDGNPTIRFRLKVNGTVYSLISDNTILQNNTWYHIVGTYDGTKIRLYINGTEVDDQGVVGSVDKNPSVSAVIGAAPVAMSKRFKGKIDQVRIYSRGLSAAEITSLYNQGL